MLCCIGFRGMSFAPSKPVLFTAVVEIFKGLQSWETKFFVAGIFRQICYFISSNNYAL